MKTPTSSSSRIKPLMRAAKPSDASAVALLLGQLGYECTREEAAQRIATLLEDTSQTLIVADLHGDICGLMALSFMYYLPLGRLTCRITALIVNDIYRMHGIGRDLLRDAESRARTKGAARVEVTTAAHRHEAHHFYRACGYIESSLRFVKRLGN